MKLKGEASLGGLVKESMEGQVIGLHLKKAVFALDSLWV